MKLYLWPSISEIEFNNGIGRIVHAQSRYLSDYGIDFVGSPEQADLTACHTQQANARDLDVLHLHGMYWTGEPESGHYDAWHWRANEYIVRACRRARALTVPSPWCQTVFQRDMRISPTVIGHGLDFGEWEPGEPKGYVLWNKNRNRDVCDPTATIELARRGARVVTTFIPDGQTAPENITVTGSLPHDQMKTLVAHADVYLATVKETYGIGTLEAMACGVPVLGFRHGGTADLVAHGVTGYLAEPGDYEDLFEGLAYCLANRDRLGEAGREAARQRNWPLVIGEYARFYEAVLKAKQAEPEGVSVVITNYNYGQHIGEAIESALSQTMKCEVIVVDDGSTDNSSEVISRFRDQVRPIFQKNQGVAAARNAGVLSSSKEFIICLDADDRLDPRYAQVLSNVLKEDRGLGVVYTGLSRLEPDGNLSANVGWPPAFSWRTQSSPGNPPPNCIPTAAMFRKELWRRSGGYRQEYAPGEDAEFFTRGLSLGFTASQLTEDGLFHYRIHPDSASRTKRYIPIDAYLPWINDRKYPLAAPMDKGVPPVISYSVPLISVIISGPPKYLKRALDSLAGQSVREWEVIVPGMDVPSNYPFVRRVEGGWQAGFQAAKAPLIYCLPSDGYFLPGALVKFCKAYSESGGRYVYSDYFQEGSGKIETEDYMPERVLEKPLHPFGVLISARHAKEIEFTSEWEFAIECAVKGFHGRRLAEALVVLPRGVRRTRGIKKGDRAMGSCCGGDSGQAIMAAKAAVMGQNSQLPAELTIGQESPPVVRMEFTGTSQGAASYGGPGVTPSGKRYRAGANPHNRFIDADARDVAWLISHRNFRIVVATQDRIVPSPEANPQLVEELVTRMEAKPDAGRLAAGRRARNLSPKSGD